MGVRVECNKCRHKGFLSGNCMKTAEFRGEPTYEFCRVKNADGLCTDFEAEYDFEHDERYDWPTRRY
jgi:hypothetical protein